MKKEIAVKILNETEEGYDLIADKFSATRKHFWRGLEFIGDYTKDEDKILDFGCGNGRLLELFIGKQIEYTGVDISEKLIEIAQQKYHSENVKFQKISGQASLSLADDYFNIVYSIAVFHHLPGKDLRVEMGKELCRVLKPGGRVVITVWNLWQKKYLKNLLSNWLSKLKGESLSPHQFSNKLLNIIFLNKLRLYLKNIILGENWCGDVDWNDCYISFTDNQGQVFRRYHHAFTKRDLENLFIQAGFEVEKCEVSGGRNLVLVGRKPQHQ